MSSFNNALGSIWGAVGGTLSIITDASTLASGFVRKHKTQQSIGYAADIEVFTSSKMLEVDEVLQRNAEKRSSLNQDLVSLERERVSQILSQI